MAGASRLAAVTAQTGLLDPTARQRHGPSIDIGLVVGAGETETLAIAAAGTRAVAAHLAEATHGTRRRRLLGPAVERQAGPVDGSCEARMGFRERRSGEAIRRHVGPGGRVEVHDGDGPGEGRGRDGRREAERGRRLGLGAVVMRGEEVRRSEEAGGGGFEPRAEKLGM